MHLIKQWSALCLALMVLLTAAAPARAEFPLKDGDTWVMAGDSITAQRLHSNYFEAFCYARYPGMKFAFRNSGVGGHTIVTTLARFDYDIAAWSPTVVSVELGMNDQHGTTTEKFVSNMAVMVDRIRAIKARPVLFSPSPINNGNSLATTGGTSRLHEYAVALKEYSAKEQIPYADQFHDLVDVWAANKPRENLLTAVVGMKQIALDSSVVGVEHLREFIKAQEAVQPRPVSMMGDPVHPGPTGQLMMAAALLKELSAESFVSSATLNASGTVVEKKSCKIDGAKAQGGGVVFGRLDERLPFPIPEDARAVLAFDPTILNLSQYTLKVTGLKAGSYALKIDNVLVTHLTEKDLAAGVNLTALGAEAGKKEVSPIVAQGQAILAAVAAKEQIVGQWRVLSQQAHAANAAPELMTQLKAMTARVEEADQKIREAAKPRVLHFEITPAP